MEQHLISFPITSPSIPSSQIHFTKEIGYENGGSGGSLYDSMPPSKRHCFNNTFDSKVESKNSCTLGRDFYLLKGFSEPLLCTTSSHASKVEVPQGSLQPPPASLRRTPDSQSLPDSCNGTSSPLCLPSSFNPVEWNSDVSSFSPTVSQSHNVFSPFKVSTRKSPQNQSLCTPDVEERNHSQLCSSFVDYVRPPFQASPTTKSKSEMPDSQPPSSCETGYMPPSLFTASSRVSSSFRTDSDSFHHTIREAQGCSSAYDATHALKRVPPLHFFNVTSKHNSVSFVKSEVERLESDLSLSLGSLKILLDQYSLISSGENLVSQKQSAATSTMLSDSFFLTALEHDVDILEAYLGIYPPERQRDPHGSTADIMDSDTKPLEPNRFRSWSEYYQTLQRHAITKGSVNAHPQKASLDPPSATVLPSDLNLIHKEGRRRLRRLDFQHYLRMQVLGYHHLIASPTVTSSVKHCSESHCDVVTMLPPLLYITPRELKRFKFLNDSRARRQAVLNELEDRKRARAEFIRDILRHRVRFTEFHGRASKIIKRLGQAASKVVATSLEKRTSLGLSFSEIQFSKERMAALKAKDEVQYMKLLRETKNHRLLELVRQTEEYMKKLGHLVTQHREIENQKHRNCFQPVSQQSSDSASSFPPNDREGCLSVQPHDGALLTFPPATSGDNPDNAAPFDALVTAKNHYFTLTHSIQENIVNIPACLVGGALREYQLKGLTWMVSLYNNNLNGILADAMGLGKTIQTIALLAYLYEFKRNKGPFLIVAPLSTLHSGWSTEFDRWLPSFIKVVYDGSKEARRSLRQKYFSDCSFNVLLTTDSFIMKDCTYLRRIHWEYLIVDEAHRLKNPKSKLVQVLTDKRQSRGFRIKRRLALTGTPLQNDLQEVWSLLNFLMPTIFSSSETFRSWFNAPLGQAGSQHHVDITEEEQLLVVDRLHKVLRPFLLRREKKEVENEVPRKHEEVIWCPMSGVQQRLYHDIEKGHISPDVSSSNTLMQLRKVCNHPYLFCLKTPLGLDIPTDESIIRLCGKFWVLDDILPKLQATGHRVLIFSQMVKLLNILEIFLSLRGWRFLRLDGSTSGEERLRRLSLFNAPDSPYFIFALSTRAGGLGVNLQSADTVIIYDSDWNPQNDEQAQSRAHRIGQTKEVLILRLVTADTVEERILSAAAVKLDKDALVIKSGMFYDSGNDLEDERRDRVRAILSKKNKKQQVTFYEREAVNRTLARSKDELRTFSRVDRLRQVLGLGHLMASSALPHCLARMEHHASSSKEDWKTAYGRDCPWSVKNKGASPYPPVPDFLPLKKNVINDAIIKAVEFVEKHPYFCTSPKDAAPFIALPDTTECAGYQDIIQKPMCLNYIKTFAERRNFSSLTQVEKYLTRISSNCRRFNGSDHCLFYQALRLTGSILYRARENCCRAVAALELQYGWRSKEDILRLQKTLDDIVLLSRGVVIGGQVLEDEEEEEEEEDDEDEDELSDIDDTPSATGSSLF